MNLLTKITLEHFAWFDNEIRDTSPPEAAPPLVGDLKTLNDYKSQNFRDSYIMNHVNTVTDVLYDKDVIDRETWLNTT